MSADEIVRALKCCSRVDAQCNGCDGCPLEYCGPECDLLCKNAATLIESLQADLRHEEKVSHGQMEQNKRLRKMVDKLQAQLAESQRIERAAVEDLYMACKHSPCNTGICVKKNCTGNYIPCEFEWRGPQEAVEGGQDGN